MVSGPCNEPWAPKWVLGPGVAPRLGKGIGLKSGSWALRWDLSLRPRLQALWEVLDIFIKRTRTVEWNYGLGSYVPRTHSRAHFILLGTGTDFTVVPCPQHLKP